MYTIYTSAHLVRGLKCTACIGVCVSLKIQGTQKVAKIRHLRTIAQLCRAISS